jgi:6,7-dimethyl-8-ribityllumazine synthase
MSGDKLTWSLDARGLRVAVVAARFNSEITDKLLAGALEALRKAGADEASIEVIRVPGAFELPLAAKALPANHDAVVALGAVVRGDTPHFDYVAGEAARGIQQVSLESSKPVAFGVLTTETMQQAVDRAGGSSTDSEAGDLTMNKGFDAANTAIEMAMLLKRLRGGA